MGAPEIGGTQWRQRWAKRTQEYTERKESDTSENPREREDLRKSEKEQDMTETKSYEDFLAHPPALLSKSR